MNAKRLFEDDDDLFADPDATDPDDRPSHVELRLDRSDTETQRELPAADDFLARIPRLAVSEADLTGLPLDHRAGFVLSEVDGVSTIETILDLCPMPADEALEILVGLIERGILTAG